MVPSFIVFFTYSDHVKGLDKFEKLACRGLKVPPHSFHLPFLIHILWVDTLFEPTYLIDRYCGSSRLRSPNGHFSYVLPCKTLKKNEHLIRENSDRPQLQAESPFQIKLESLHCRALIINFSALLLCRELFCFLNSNFVFPR